MVFKLFESSDYEKLLEFYRRIDSEFYPRLSQRRGGLEGHIQQVLSNNGSFALFETDNLIHGAVGFFPLDVQRKIVQFNLFAFTKNYRGTLYPYKMTRYLTSLRNPLG